MPLLEPIEKTKKEPVTLNLNSAVWQKTLEYCEWAKFENQAEFIEQAIEFVLKKDRDWKQYQAAKKMPDTSQPSSEVWSAQ